MVEAGDPITEVDGHVAAETDGRRRADRAVVHVEAIGELDAVVAGFFREGQVSETKRLRNLAIENGYSSQEVRRTAEAMLPSARDGSSPSASAIS